MSLGNDLTTIRKERNLSLEDIFEATKIPVHTLKSIENDTLLKSSSEGKTYLRSFIRSYAKALKIPDPHILAALKDTEANTYNSTLISLVHPSPDSKPSHDDSQIDTKIPTGQEKVAKEGNNTNLKSDGGKPTVGNINWAAMNKKVYASPTNSKIGLLVIIIAVISGLGIIGYFYGGSLLSVFSSEENTEQTLNDDNDADITNEDLFSVSEDTSITITAGDLNENTQLTTPTLSTLPDTLTVILYAAYDKLEPVRVTSDFNNRTNPFWMDKGDAYYFDFKDSLLVRGQYARFLLMYNGSVINNARQNHFDADLNSIVITRDILNSPEYLENNINNFPTNLGVQPPDSIIYRLEF